jgi:HemX protein
MSFVLPAWMYDLIIYLYALSLLFYFSDFVETSRIKKRMATGLLYFVWFLQTVFFMARMFEYRSLTVMTMFESLFFYAWLLLTISLVINRFFRMDLIVFAVNLLAFAVLLMNLFSSDSLQALAETEIIRNELIVIHVTMAFASYIAFTLAALLAVFYLWLHRQLKRKKWSNLTKRLPHLTQIETYMFWCVVWGLPLFIINILLAVIWSWQQGGLIEWNDPKIYNTLLVALAYVFFLYQKMARRVSGVSLARYNLLAMLFVILNYVVSNFLSDFHNWVWH